VENLNQSNCGRRARVIVEKPFGQDLASARQLNDVLLSVFDEADIFRIDRYLGKRAERISSSNCSSKQCAGIPLCQHLC
jgi:glucose-6-phosphate 1-dehydrogenase